MFTTLLLASGATAFNAAIIIYKLKDERYTDSLVDLSVSGVMTALYAGTMGGMIVAMVASFLLSVYLLFNPIKLPEVDTTPIKIWSSRIAVAVLVVSIIVVANMYSAAILTTLL